MEAIRNLASGVEHSFHIATGRDANQNFFLAAQKYVSALHHLRSQQQRKFAKLQQRARVRRRVVRRSVDYYNFVRGPNEFLGDGFSPPFTGDPLHGILLFGDVLQVYGGDNSDSGVEKFLHIFPALGVAASWRVVIGELVDETNLRPAGKDRVDVKSSVRRNNLEFLQQLLNVGRLFRLDHSDDHVLPALPPPPPGWTRDYVIAGDGWVKDGDYNSVDSATVLPPAERARAVEFRDVWFRYPGARERGWVLQEISFSVRPGASLAIVGATGSGKSTLVDLLIRAYDPDRGSVLIDGIDIRRLALENLRRAVGFVPQETFLFGETLRRNILLGAPDDGRLEEVARVAQLTEALPALPAGYETLIGERGINLSGGQKQRAAIARALAQDPPIFVLDDALSAVDAQTEARILAGLRSALSGRTSIIVSHRLAAVRDADWILVLDGGRIVEQGVHAELLAAGGRYWELLRRQQMEEELEEVKDST